MLDSDFVKKITKSKQLNKLKKKFICQQVFMIHFYAKTSSKQITSRAKRREEDESDLNNGQSPMILGKVHHRSREINIAVDCRGDGAFGGWQGGQKVEQTGGSERKR